jgi:IS30 family transposase
MADSLTHQAEIAVMMNERPRETLGWRSPAEAYAELLNGAMTT